MVSSHGPSDTAVSLHFGISTEKVARHSLTNRCFDFLGTDALVVTFEGNYDFTKVGQIMSSCKFSFYFIFLIVNIRVVIGTNFLWKFEKKI